MTNAGRVLLVGFLSFGALVYQQQAARAGAYDDQCKAAGGTALTWDGVGLRWCCTKRGSGYLQRKNSRAYKTTLWCKS